MNDHRRAERDALVAARIFFATEKIRTVATGCPNAPAAVLRHLHRAVGLLAEAVEFLLLKTDKEVEAAVWLDEGVADEEFWTQREAAAAQLRRRRVQLDDMLDAAAAAAHEDA